MRIPTKVQYGLRAMVELAMAPWGECIPLSNIADHQGISLSYLEQAFSVLRKSGLVRSEKGAQGGYSLARKPNQITVGRILRELDGELSISGSVVLDHGSDKLLQDIVWDKVDQKINSVVETITLEDLVYEYYRSQGNTYYMAYI
ncbi:MAG: RrF2 family transcriptional regulator [Acidobacteriota bacterium]